jgi:hypothetical protein
MQHTCSEGKWVYAENIRSNQGGRLMKYRLVLARAIPSLLFLCTCATLAGAQTFTLDSHVISAGASSLASSSCFRMAATIAEPVAGFSSSATYGLAGGFQDTLTPSNDSIFFNGFEDCTP